MPAIAQDTLVVQRAVVLREAPSVRARRLRVLPVGERLLHLGEDTTAPAFLRVRNSAGDSGFVSLSFVRSSRSDSGSRASRVSALNAHSPRAARTCGVACGAVRWAVKTFTDDDAGAVDLTPEVGHIGAMRQFHAPSPRPVWKVPQRMVLDGCLYGPDLSGP